MKTKLIIVDNFKNKDSKIRMKKLEEIVVEILKRGYKNNEIKI